MTTKIITTLSLNGKPRRRRRRGQRRPPRFADFSLARQTHIRALLASLRQVVREARREVLDD